MHFGPTFTPGVGCKAANLLSSRRAWPKTQLPEPNRLLPISSAVLSPPLLRPSRDPAQCVQLHAISGAKVLQIAFGVASVARNAKLPLRLNWGSAHKYAISLAPAKVSGSGHVAPAA